MRERISSLGQNEFAESGCDVQLLITAVQRINVILGAYL